MEHALLPTLNHSGPGIVTVMQALIFQEFWKVPTIVEDSTPSASNTALATKFVYMQIIQRVQAHVYVTEDR